MGNLDKQLERVKKARQDLRQERQTLHAELREERQAIHAELREERQAIHAELREAFQREHPSGQVPSQDCLARAKARYDEITGLLAQVSFAIRQQSGRDVSPMLLQRNFDIMLQTVLLRTAVGDDDFCRAERQFIREIAGTGDVVVWVNRLYEQEQKEPMTWGKLYYLEEAELTELMNYITANSRQLMEEAFLPLAQAESVTGVDYQALILQKIKEICKCFASIDGDDDNPEEDRAMQQAIDFYFAQPVSQARKAWASRREGEPT